MTTGQAPITIKTGNALDVANTTSNIATNEAELAAAGNIDGKDVWPQSVVTQRINIAEAMTIGDQVTLTDGCIKANHLDTNSVTTDALNCSLVTATDMSFSGTLSGFNITALGNISSGALAIGTGGVTIGSSGSGIYIGTNTITAVVGGVPKFSLNGTTGAAYFAGEIAASKFVCTANADNSANFGAPTTIGGNLTVNGNIFMSTTALSRSIYLDSANSRSITWNQALGEVGITAAGSGDDVVIYGTSHVYLNGGGASAQIDCNGTAVAVAANLNVTGNIAATGTVRSGSGAYFRSGSGVPAAGLGTTGDIYASTGGSLYFKQAAGWKRIDNWES